MNLERHERLNEMADSMNGIDLKLTVSGKDYREVMIPEGAVVYCDIPYESETNPTYDVEFDHEEFYDWAERQSYSNPVFISEYAMPDARFECVFSEGKLNTLCADQTKHVTERIFVPRQRG